MKKLCLFFLTPLVGLFLFSCEKIGNEKQETEVDFSIMGKMHNAGLDSIFIGLQEAETNFDQSLAKEGTRATYISTIKSRSISYVRAETDNDAEAVAIATEYLDKFLDDKPEYTDHKAIENSIYTPYILSRKRRAVFNSKLNELNGIATDEDENLQSLLSRLQQLETSVRSSSLTADEKNILLAGVSVAQESYQYWYDKGQEWLKTLKVQSKKRKFSWKRVVRADISGAVDGAVAIGVAALGGPIGWVAVVTGVAGAAAGSSAGNAVDQLLEEQ